MRKMFQSQLCENEKSCYTCNIITSLTIYFSSICRVRLELMEVLINTFRNDF